MSHGFEIDTMEATPDHDYVHAPFLFPPQHSTSDVIGTLKSMGARGIFRDPPEVKTQRWSGEF